MDETPGYNRRIVDLTAEDRPREKALAKGFGALTTSELIAILLGSGSKGESVIDLSQRILRESGNKLTELSKRSARNLTKSFRGIGDAKAITLLAAIELGKRYAQENPGETPQITSPERAFDLMFPILYNLPHEEFWAIYLNNSKRVIRKIRISQGGTAATVVDAKIIFRHAVENLASAIILAHNHPSGNPRPSREDDIQTDKLCKAARLLDMSVVDHIIICGNSFYSYAEEGKL